MGEGQMTDLEEAKLKIDYLEDYVQNLELRLQNVLSYIEYVLHRQKETKDE